MKITIVVLLVVLGMLGVGMAVDVTQIQPVIKQEGHAQDAVVLTAPRHYVIGAEDVLEISVWGESELSKTMEVSSDGTINYPLLGILDISGMTLDQLQAMLTEQLSQGYLKDPKVTVSIKDFNSKKVMVFGLVASPGIYKIKGPLPLLELLFMAGNVSRESGNKLVIMRKDAQDPDAQPKAVAELSLDDLLLKGDLSKNVLIQPGDTVYITSNVTERSRFYVMGQVKQPGPYDFTRPVTLLEAIKVAGGLTDYAAPKRVQLLRKDGEKKLMFKFNVNDIMVGKKSDDFIVQPGDVIVVPESWF